MTDRPALAQLLADEAERRGQPGLVDRLARVLAEHETAQKEQAQAEVKPAGWTCPTCGLCDRRYHEQQIENLKAAEARCAQVEQEREFQRARADKWVAVAEKQQAEHERLRASLEPILTLRSSWDNAFAKKTRAIIEAALAPSQEPK